MLKLKSSALSHIGLKRPVNEDSYICLPEKNLFVIADGMGGHNAGEFAGRMAVSCTENFVNNTFLDENITWPFGMNKELSLDANKLITAIRIANQNIYQKAKTQETYKNMGSTIVAMLVTDNTAAIAYVGDSRAYKIHQNTLEQLTVDHSWVREQIQKGILSENESKNHRLKNVLTRALGVEPEVKVDVRTEKINSGDYIILCSDGLTNFVDDETIKNIILDAKEDINSASQNLITTANENSGRDNITVIIVHFEENPVPVE